MTVTEDLAAGSIGGKSSLCLTPTTQAIMSLCALCQAEGELGFVLGNPGVGKSSSAIRYAQTKQDAFLVTMSPATNSLVACLARIGEVLRARPVSYTGPAWSDAIRLQLWRQSDAPLLIIDEIHHASDAGVEEIRAIFDEIPHLGVVFIGSREIHERWSGRRWAQLTSRVYQRIDIDEPLPSDVDALCAAVGVDGKRSRDLMRRAATRPGGLRVVRKMLDVAAKLAAGQPIKTEHVEAAYQDRGDGA